MQSNFHIESKYLPTGDQPTAIAALLQGLERGESRLALEGVTGSGKTFTMANAIQGWGRPTLILSHNKTLAAQLFAELKSFFPDNAIEYFVSYYDYYQPEAYIPQTDTFIEKDSSINEEIERYRLSATNSLLGRRDVIIVASVSCIYGLGSPEDYREMLVDLTPGMELERDHMLAQLVDIQYARNDYESVPGNFRVRGDTVDIFPSYDKNGYRIAFFGDEIEEIKRFDPVSGKCGPPLRRVIISPAKHFVMPREKVAAALGDISRELDQRIAEFEAAGKLVEAQRIRQRTEFDMEMMRELGFCSGIENYSRHLAGRAAGETPACLLDYFDGEFLTIIDESHVTLPQLRAMYNGDQARKGTLIEHGFRLPSARDNRPLNFEEFMHKTGPIIFASATPGWYEREVSAITAQQLIRPTGLLDPPVEVRALANQIDDLMEQIKRTVEDGNRVLVTTLTKRSSEDLAAYLKETGVKVEYLHSDIDAIERVDILGRLRKGEFDCLIGINLLREGLDLPEVALVAVLDADKEGFLRSSTALMQTAGRAARHENGRVILYASKITGAMRTMMEITSIRRERQQAYNIEYNITPQSVKRDLNETLAIYREGKRIESSMVAAESEEKYDVCQMIGELQREMLTAAEALEFERAAALRDEIKELRRILA
ncbi:MAG: excinuclease ABC subunit UvrB [Kiritimatiellia bacterium]